MNNTQKPLDTKVTTNATDNTAKVAPVVAVAPKSADAKIETK